VYLDPPFNSKTDYNILFKTSDNIDSPSQIMAFEDTWHWTNESEMVYGQLLGTSGRIASVIKGMREAIGENDMMAYLVMMAIRLIELHRILKSTGSLYLHCDPTASHYLKIILDAIFDPRNFRNEIIWKRATSGQKGSQYKSKKYGAMHDIILYYSKNKNEMFFKIPKKQITSEELDKLFPFEDKYGRWKDDSHHIFRTPGMGVRPNLCYTWKGITNPHPSGWRLSKQRLEEEYQKGNIEINKKGKVIRKARMKDYKGENLNDVWADIDPAQGRERMGYPTQKPTALLERIIKASSNVSDVILDPFCGCGTAIHASQKLNRNWIGIDITHLAIGLIEKRMKDAFGIKVTVKGTPTSFESAQDLAKRNKFQFEAWAVTLIPNVLPNKKQVGDRGVDGRGYISLGKDKNGKRIDAKIIVSVKGGDSLTPSMVRDLIGTMSNEKAELGVFISLREPTRKMKEAAITAGYFETPLGEKYQKLQIYTISDFFNGVIPKLPSMIDFVISQRTSKMRDKGTQTTLSDDDS